MAQDLTSQIVITGDAAGVETAVGRAKKSLADLGVAATAAGKQGAAGLDSISQSGEGVSKKVQAQTNNLVGSIQRQIATLEAGSRSGSKFFETLASQRGVPVDALRPYLDQLDQVIAKQKLAGDGAKFTPKVSTLTTSLGATNFSKPLDAVGTSLGASAFGAITEAAAKTGATVAKTGIQFNEFGLSAKQTAAALRQVPAQFTDILVSLQGGQAPLTVLLQQGGQLKDVFGGIGPAARALGGYIVGLINPFTVAAAAAAALAFAYKQGSAEADAFARAIVLSGNGAGTTIGQLQGMAAAISGVVGTQGKAAEALAAFAASGDIANANLQSVAQAAVKLERVGGQAIEKTVQQFSSLAKDPLQSALKLNESTNFLTRSLYDQIKALDEVGRTADAAAVAQRGYAEVIEQRTATLTDRLGTLEKAWQSLGDSAKKAWDFMLNVGRPDTLESQLSVSEQRVRDLQALQEQLASGQKRGGLGGLNKGQIDDEIAAERLRSTQISMRVDKEVAYAQAAKISNDQVKARAEFDKDGLRFLSERKKLEQDITKAIEQGKAAGATPKEIKDRVADIQAAFDKKQPKGAKPEDFSKNTLAAQIALTKNLLDQEVGAFRNAESILEAVRSAGLVGESEYYAAKRAFINLTADAEQKALAGQIAALEIENARIAGQKGKQSEFIDNKRKIADAETKIATVVADAATKVTIATIQQEAAVQRLAVSLLSARQSAEDFFAQTERQQDRELNSFGRGNQQRQRDSGVRQVEDRFADQRRDLENQKALLELEGKFTQEARLQYDARLGIINEFQAKSLDSFNAYYDKLIARERDFGLGIQESLRNYADEASKVGKQISDALTSAFNGLENVLTDFFTTGKLDAKSFATSIISDINRIIVRQNITGPLAQVLQGGVGGLFGSVPGADGAATAGASGAAAVAAQAGQQAVLLSGITASSAANAAAITAAIAVGDAAGAASEAASTAAIVSAVGVSTTAIVSAIAAAAATDGVGGALNLASLFGLSGGGYTGDAAVNVPVGVVHGKEYVFSEPAVRRIGVGQLDEMHRKARAGAPLSGLRGFADGGYVAPRMFGVTNKEWSSPIFNLKFENAPRVDNQQRRRNASGGEDVLVKFARQIKDEISSEISGGYGVANAIGGRFGFNNGATLAR